MLLHAYFNHKDIFGQFSSIFVAFLLTTAWDIPRSTSGKHEGQNPRLWYMGSLELSGTWSGIVS